MQIICIIMDTFTLKVVKQGNTILNLIIINIIKMFCHLVFWWSDHAFGYQRQMTSFVQMVGHVRHFDQGH